MNDVRGLILNLALVNLSFALLVWIYVRSLKSPNPQLRLWQCAKLVCGAGFLLGWARPLAPLWLQSFGVLGNSLQLVGIALELLTYCRFLGLHQWPQRIRYGLALALGVFILADLLKGPAAMIVTGTLAAGMGYASMAWIMLNNHRDKDRPLMGTLGALDALLALLLLFKGVLGLFVIDMVRYTANEINIALYTVAGMTAICNGFGFLLLVKQDANRELQRALGELSQTNVRQRQFISMLAHEVRTPLSVVDASAQVLSLRLPPDNDNHAVVARIRRGVSHLSGFFDNCLTQDRLNADDYVLQPVPVDMAELLTWVRDSALQINEFNAIHLDVANTLLQVSGDPTLLRIVVANLLSNAIKYSPADKAITLRATEHANCCRIEVIDQGPGIEREDFQVIFQTYRRGRAAERVPGTGLGLALVRRIVDLHGGTVGLQSSANQGTRFTVDLPLRAAQ